MSSMEVEHDLDNILKTKDKVFVLFYASWCPFCQRFLPIFEKFSQDKTQDCVIVKTDDRESLREKFLVDVVPTVIFFENGRPTRRLDGIQGIGLDEKKLVDFASRCQGVADADAEHVR